MRLATWNTQGYKFGDSVIARLLRENDIDILCLQECGDLSHLGSIYEAARGRKYKIHYYPWGSENLRCSLAILVKADMTVMDFRVCELPKDLSVDDDDGDFTESEDETHGGSESRKGLRGMPWLKIMGRVRGEDITIGTVHLPSGCSNFARKVWNKFKMEMSGQWCVLGDFNIPDLSGDEGIISPNAPTHASFDSTRSQSTLDYLYAPGVDDVGLGDVLTEYTGISDHLPVVFDVDI